MEMKWVNNIKILNEYLNQTCTQINYCGISSIDDFHNYETEIDFKYKIINEKRQLSKLSDFISEYKPHLDYDWYIKVRPDTKLLDKIDFSKLSESAINGRARMYTGPLKIQHGMSVNGAGIFRFVGDCFYNPDTIHIQLDDMIFIFDNNVINAGAFDPITENAEKEDELFQYTIWSKRNIKVNVIGINLKNTTHNVFSGDLNM